MADEFNAFNEAETPYDKMGELMQRLEREGATVTSRFCSAVNETEIDLHVAKARIELHEKIELTFSMASMVRALSHKAPLTKLNKDSGAIEGHLQKAIVILKRNEDLDLRISMNMNTDDPSEPLAILNTMVDAVRSIRQTNPKVPVFDKERLSHTLQARLIDNLAKVYEEAFALGPGGAAASITKAYDNYGGPFVVFLRFCLEKYGDPHAPPMTPAALTMALKRSVLKGNIPS